MDFVFALFYMHRSTPNIKRTAALRLSHLFWVLFPPLQNYVDIPYHNLSGVLGSHHYFIKGDEM